VQVYKNSKLDERGVEAVWIGPSAETPDGQKIFWPKKSTITVERNVRFDDGSVFGEGTSEGGVLTSEQQSQQSPAQTAPRNLKTQSHTSQKTLSRSGSSRPTRRIEKGTRKPRQCGR
jgi:hypothetical protein